MSRELALGQRVRILLSQEGMEREDVRFYLAAIKDSIDRIDQKAGRCSFALIFSGAIFILLSNGHLIEAEIFNVKVQDFSLLRLLIPVVASFLVAQIVVLMNGRGLLRDLYRELLRQYMPRWEEVGLGSVPVSSSGFFLAFTPPLLTKTSEVLARRTFFVEVAVLLLFPILFGVYAYISIFADDRIGTVWALASLLLCLLFLLIAFAHLVVNGRDLSANRNAED